MRTRRAVGCAALLWMLIVGITSGAGSEVADAAQKGDRAAVQKLIQQKADVNAAQVDGATALYQEEVPVAYVADGGLGQTRHRFVITLEYGKDHDTGDPFDISVPRVVENDAANARDASYLHPVVRHYRDGAPVGVHHLAENLENQWTLPTVHQQPLAVFVKECLADAG